jgi:hypothetical protein
MKNIFYIEMTLIMKNYVKINVISLCLIKIFVDFIFHELTYLLNFPKNKNISVIINN